MDEVVERWFCREILLHEASLTRYLARVWPNRDEVADLRQEIYTKVFDASLRRLPAMPKAYLFASARHVMADRVRRSRISFIGMRADLDAMNVLIEEISPERRVSALQELSRLACAFDRLPAQCRAVMWLRKVEQLPQKDVAARMGVHEKAIEKQVARGMRLLANELLNGQFDADLPTDAQPAESESGHGQRNHK